MLRSLPWVLFSAMTLIRGTNINEKQKKKAQLQKTTQRQLKEESAIKFVVNGSRRFIKKKKKSILQHLYLQGVNKHI